MTTFQVAATDFLAKITPTHTSSTMRTYQRNFDVVLTPYFGADTELASIASETVQSFFSADALLVKPNGQPRAQPTMDQITGLLRSFLADAVSAGLITALPDLPQRSRRSPVVRLCDRCRAPLGDVPITAPVAVPEILPAPAASEKVTATPRAAAPAIKVKTGRERAKAKPASRKAKAGAGKRNPARK